MDIIQQLPFPDEICSKILLYAFKSPHIHLQEEIFKHALSIPIYQQLMAGGGIVKDADGSVTELSVWNIENGDDLLGAAERESLQFDIRVLQWLPNLTTFSISCSPGVTGDIQVLQGLPNLTTFELNDTSVFGNIQVLQGLQHLTEFALSFTGVFGDIQVLPEFIHLTRFWLGGSHVFGDIQVLQGFQNLTHFSLGHNPSVTGDENAFHNYRETHGLKECKVYM